MKKIKKIKIKANGKVKSIPENFIALAHSFKSLYLPVPTMSLELNLLFATTNFLLNDYPPPIK